MKKLKGIDGKLDDAWSELVKLEAGYKCEYCGKNTTLNSHHIFSRSNRSVRWDERNVHPQCRRDNHFMGGRQDDYARFIIKKYGQNNFDELMRLKYTTVKHTRSDLEEMIELYKEKLENIR